MRVLRSLTLVERNDLHAIGGMFVAVLERELGDAGLSSSPRSSAIMRSYCSFVARQIAAEVAH